MFGRRLRSEPCAQFQLSYLHRTMRSGETPSRHPMHTDVKYWICPSYFTFFGNDTRKHVFQLFYSSFASLHFQRPSAVTVRSHDCHVRQSIFIFILLFLLFFGVFFFSLAICHLFKLIFLTPTSMHPGACCFGLRKNVPSTSGYLSKTNIGSSQSTHDTRLFWCCASDDKMNNLVSSLPWFPSSSICPEQNERKIYLVYSNL